MRYYLKILALTIGAVIALTGCLIIDDDTQPSKVGGSNPTESQTQSDGDDKDIPAEFGVGDTVEYKGVKYTLDGIRQHMGGGYTEPDEGKIFVACDFTVVNNSDKDVVVSGWLESNSYVDGYAVNNNYSAIEDDNELDGTVAPGKKLKGSMGYELDNDWEELEIHFDLEFWQDKKMVFKITNDK